MIVNLFKFLKLKIGRFQRWFYVRLIGQRPFNTIFSFNWGYIRPLVQTIRQLDCFFQGRILDLGAGHSPYYSLVSKNASVYIAMDFPSSLPETESREIVRRTGCLEAIPLPNESIDTVFCSQVFGYAADPACGMKEIARVLSLGGHAFISVPHIAPIYDYCYDSYRFTTVGFSRLAETHGLRVVRIEVQGYMFTAFALCLATNLVTNQLGPDRPIHFCQYREILFAPLICLTNCVAWTLDHILPWNRTPSNFVLVAQKFADSNMLREVDP